MFAKNNRNWFRNNKAIVKTEMLRGVCDETRLFIFWCLRNIILEIEILWNKKNVGMVCECTVASFHSINFRPVQWQQHRIIHVTRCAGAAARLILQILGRDCRINWEMQAGRYCQFGQQVNQVHLVQLQRISHVQRSHPELIIRVLCALCTSRRSSTLPW